MRKKNSILWKISKEKLETIVKNSSSLSEILRHFGLKNGNNFRTLKQRLKVDEIDFSHIPLGKNSNIGRIIPKKSKPLNEIMIKNSSYNRGHLKRRLIKESILEEKCAKCGMGSEWEGEPLVLILDHINGINNDHREENLRLLCPNCNSQTPTFAGRKLRKEYNCKKCGIEIFKDSSYCKKCFGLKRRKIERPAKEVLEKEVKELGYVGTGKKYGVSDNSIRKWLK
jgi:predicted RNA-binding Zn-ribbon protein involved in translation (DUF1610 family)